MKDYTQYQQRIRACFADAYNFLETHKHVRTDEQWDVIIRALPRGSDADPLTADLIVAVVKELEREYKAERSQQHEKQ